MKKVLKVLALLLGGVVLAIAAFVGWAYANVANRMDTPYAFEYRDVPIPWPLTDAEVSQLRAEKAAEIAATFSGDGAPAYESAGAPPVVVDPAADPLAGVDLIALASERAVARGKHLIEARLGCTECHGADLGGAVVIDDPAIGRLACPNITTGKGGKTAGWTGKDWDRIVRHGVRADGGAVVMPATDFAMISDQELSDLVAFIRAQPPVDRDQEGWRLGPVLTILYATGKANISAEAIDHKASRPVEAPVATADASFGKHLAEVCTGCHGPTLAGGPIAGGDPAWPPAGNLTPDATGTKGWTLADFTKVLREGIRPDGTTVDKSMPVVMTKNMTDTEIAALYAYTQSIPPLAKGAR